MIVPAQLYSEQLKQKFWEIAYDEKYMYFNSGYVDEYTPSNSSWCTTEFVSINKEGMILGYIRYEVDRWSNRAHGLCAINFSDDKVVFGFDLGKVVQNIFSRYKYRKLSFGVYTDNPIADAYDKMVKNWNGRLVGTKYQETKLMDGVYHDYRIYEITLDNYLESKAIRKFKRQIRTFDKERGNDDEPKTLFGLL